MKRIFRNMACTGLAVLALGGLMTGTGVGQERPDSFDEPASDPTFELPDIVLAQNEPGMPGRMRGPGMRPPMDSGVQRRHIEQLRLLKLLEVLDLSDDQEPQFLMAFKAMRKTMRELDDRKRKIVDRLSNELRSDKPDDKTVNSMVDTLLAGETRRGETLRGFVESMRATLKPAQVGRLVVFTEKFEFELLERVREFRERQAPRGRGPGPGNTDDSR